LILSYAVFLWLAGCGDIPYRSAGYSVDPNCREIYDKYYDISELDKDIPENIRSNQCWLRAREERDNYDLLFLEFDDQGWMQNASNLSRPARKDALDEFFGQLKDIFLDA